MTSTTRSTRFVVPRLIAVLALGVLALAACGGSSYGGSAATQPSASNKPAAASGAAVATGQTDVGTVLVDQNGKTLYAFAADTKDHSNCSGSCATVLAAGDGGGGHPDSVEGCLRDARHDCPLGRLDAADGQRVADVHLRRRRQGG